MTTETMEKPAIDFENPKPGAYYGLSFGEYAQIKANNWHLLSPYDKSAKHGHHEILHPRDASDTQVFGEAFHAAMLEPERFASEYVTRPKILADDGSTLHPNSKAYKDKKAEWEFNHSDKVHLTADEMADLRMMQEQVKLNPVASAIMAGKGRNELSIVWKDKDTGALMKGRVDRLCRVKIGIIDPTSTQPNADAIVLADFKTTRCIEPRLFNKERAKYCYHAQLALYADGVLSMQSADIVPLIIAVENSAPFDVVVYRPDDDAIENGRKRYKRLLRTHLACAKKKEWPGVSKQVVPLSIDAWEKEPSLED